jgi:hypothetical protein
MAYIEISPSTGGTATATAFTPAGNIAATNVQAAIAELDTEKVAKAGDTMTGALALPSNGTATTSLLNFGTVGTGFYGSSTSLFATTSGVLKWSIDSANSIFTVPVRVANGGVSGPGLQFAGQTQTGFYYSSGIAAAVSGVNKLTLNATDLTSTVPIVLPADPTTALQSVTKQYVDAAAALKAAKKNYIINGAMMISQENGTTAINNNGGHPVDMFGMSYAVTTGVYSARQMATVTPAGSPNRIRVTVTTADAAVAAGDFVCAYTAIEGLRMADLRSGSASAKTVTLQFGVRAPAGTYCVQFGNAAATRAYIATYVISAGEANTDVVKSVTLTLDTIGAWLSDNGVGIYINFMLMAGTNFHGAAGSWSGSGSVFATSAQFNFMGSTSNVFELFDVSLTEGNVAPPFVVPNYDSELLACERYFQFVSLAFDYVASAININAACAVTFQPDMRTGPTLTPVVNVSTNVSALNVFGSAHPRINYIQVTSLAAGRAYWYGYEKANARIT